MSKTKIQYLCAECGYDSPKWSGQCPSCKSWNSMKEFRVSKTSSKSVSAPEPNLLQRTFALSAVDSTSSPRLDTLDIELNRVLGGGMVYGSLILLGGEPGIGKSTLLLQTILNLKGNILYVAGEESPEQIKMRAERLGDIGQAVIITTAIEVGDILQVAKENKADMILVDSVQTVYSTELENAPGSIVQLRHSAMLFQRYAKETNVPIVLVGHITKEGQIAGPKLLEHIVDVVLQFEGDKMNNYRILRSIKNRFGSTEEIGLYQMTQAGLLVVDDPSQILLSQTQENLPGTAIGISLEGKRPLLVEIQALVCASIYSTPQRSTTGFDLRRLNMILAVLEKRLGLPFANSDVFLNVVGGIKVTDPALDLAVAAALISSQLDIALPDKTALCAEVGLTGEIRGATKIASRVHEAEKLGFQLLLISNYNKKELPADSTIRAEGVSKIGEVYQVLFRQSKA